MAYVLLVLAIAAEVLGTSLLKTTDGFSRTWPTVACLASYAVSFVFLARVVTELPVGLVYAVWSGLGTAAIVAIGGHRVPRAVDTGVGPRHRADHRRRGAAQPVRRALSWHR
jgi:multidrug transporter EmrE-like cation transporter